MIIQPVNLSAEDEVYRPDHAERRVQIVDCYFFFHYKEAKSGENAHCYNFLKDFKLRKRVTVKAKSVARNLKAVFKKRYAPADKYGDINRL